MLLLHSADEPTRMSSCVICAGAFTAGAVGAWAFFPFFIFLFAAVLVLLASSCIHTRRLVLQQSPGNPSSPFRRTEAHEARFGADSRAPSRFHQEFVAPTAAAAVATGAAVSVAVADVADCAGVAGPLAADCAAAAAFLSGAAAPSFAFAAPASFCTDVREGVVTEFAQNCTRLAFLNLVYHQRWGIRHGTFAGAGAGGIRNAGFSTPT